MSDLISKSETIDLLYQVFEKHSMATDKNDFLGGFGAELFKNIKAMPTAYSVDKGDMKHNLAEMYAKNMVDYGVDVTKAWQTATQQSCALEKAYIRGRQYEADRLIELRKEYNDGWIPCSERLPKFVFSGDMIQKMLKEEYNKAIDDLIAECENAKFAESDEISLSDVHTGVNSGLSMAIHFAKQLKAGDRE